MRTIPKLIVFFILAAVLPVFLIAQPAVSQAQSSVPVDFWDSLDAYIKVIGGGVAAVTAILGLPVAFLQVRKTIAEIRKIELESDKLRGQAIRQSPAENGGNEIYLKDSHSNHIEILVDPRFSAPLLILLDFVIVYILLALLGYAINIFFPVQIGRIILTIAGAFLLLPMLWEASRLRGSLRAAWDKDGPRSD